MIDMERKGRRLLILERSKDNLSDDAAAALFSKISREGWVLLDVSESKEQFVVRYVKRRVS